MKKKNNGEGYNHGACKGLMKIYSCYLGFDHLIFFDGSRKLV
jgi:hypothetical protein